MFIVSPNKFHKIVARIESSLLFFWSSGVRHKMSKILMHFSLWHCIKVACNYYFKKPDGKCKYYLSILACCKDEGFYLQEWIEYHLLQGVEHFYLYNNNGTDDSKEKLKKYIDAGIVTWVDWPGTRQQEAMYNDGIEKHRYSTRWMLILDIDEFVLPLKNAKFADFLTDYEQYNQLGMHWMIYGSSGHKEKVPGLVMERFVKHAVAPSATVKSVVNPRAVLFARVHFCGVIGKSVDENMIEIWNDNPEPTAEKVRINHYSTKSWEECYNKKKRGFPTRQLGQGGFSGIDMYFNKFDCNDVEEGDIMKKYAMEIKKRIE